MKLPRGEGKTSGMERRREVRAPWVKWTEGERRRKGRRCEERGVERRA